MIAFRDRFVSCITFPLRIVYYHLLSHLSTSRESKHCTTTLRSEQNIRRLFVSDRYPGLADREQIQRNANSWPPILPTTKHLILSHTTAYPYNRIACRLHRQSTSKSYSGSCRSERQKRDRETRIGGQVLVITTPATSETYGHWEPKPRLDFWTTSLLSGLHSQGSHL